MDCALRLDIHPTPHHAGHGNLDRAPIHSFLRQHGINSDDLYMPKHSMALCKGADSAPTDGTPALT